MLTLGDAHNEASRTRPAPDAPLVDWRTYHRVNAERYRVVSETDRFHHHEALYWVALEEKRHAEVKHKIAARLSTVDQLAEADAVER